MIVKRVIRYEITLTKDETLQFTAILRSSTKTLYLCMPKNLVRWKQKANTFILTLTGQDAYLVEELLNTLDENILMSNNKILAKIQASLSFDSNDISDTNVEILV